MLDARAPKTPKSLPETHARFLERAVDVLASDARVVGVAAGGSYAVDTMDAFSDLDLVIAVDPAAYEAVLEERQRIAESLGRLLAGFTGEHVFEPRLLICLYDEGQPLHVDLKFVSLDNAATRVEDPVVLWERDGLLTRALSRDVARYPQPNPQWIEDRFWVWVHYAATKIARGELLEAVDFLAFLRGTVLGPLTLAKAGARPSGVRNVERLAPREADSLRATVASVDRTDCLRALRAAVAIYRSLRPADGSVVFRAAAATAAEKYLDGVDAAAT